MLPYQLIAAFRQRLFPGPYAGSMVGLCQGAVFFFGIYQRNFTMVLFAGFIHQFKDALGASQRHDDRVDLLGNLADGHGKAAAELQERSNAAQCHCTDAGQG